MYVKIFRKILTSSIWEESDTTRIVWITMLAWMDEDGFCQVASPESLARLARVSSKAARDAVKVLESDDIKSPGQPDEGRRIERVPGGWMVLNASKYREISRREIQKAQNRAYVAKFREKKRKDQTKANTETDTYTEAKVNVSAGKISNLTPSYAKADELIQRIRLIGKWRYADASTAEHALVEQLAKGADADELYMALCRIFTWTKDGKYVHSLAEAIERWQEPANLWQYEVKKDAKTGLAEAIRRSTISPL